MSVATPKNASAEWRFAAMIAAGGDSRWSNGEAPRGARTIGSNSGRTGSVAWPVALSFIGAPLALARNFLAAAVAWIGGSSHPWHVAAAWAPFWGSLAVYPIVTVLLVWRSRQEGFSLGELLASSRANLESISAWASESVLASRSLRRLPLPSCPRCLRRLANHCSGTPTIPLPFPFPHGSSPGAF